MMTEVPRTLKEWWGNIRVAYGNEIMPYLGSLIDLLNVEANKSLITLMIEFWQPATVDFQFTDFEITPTLEEISQIANLPLAGRAPLAPCTTSGIDFLRSLGLRGWLGKALGHCFRDGLFGYYDLPKEKDCININLLPMVIFMFRGHVRVTIPYTPLRVPRQLGITQGVPLWSNMALTEVDYEGRILIKRIATLVQGWPSYEGILGFTDTQRSNQIGTELLNLMPITTTMYHQAVDDEPNEEMEEDPEKDPRKPTEEMEEDLEEYSEHDPNLSDPRDGGVMHIENEHVPTAEDAHSTDSNGWEWKIDESPEYQPRCYYDLGDDDDNAPTWSEELRQVRDLVKLSATTFLTFKTPIYFPKADLLCADLPKQPEQTQHAPAHGQVPSASPNRSQDRSNLSNRDPTIPTMQQILGAHIAAPYETNVPPVYAVGAPTFTMPVVVNVPYEVNQYEEMEKDTWLKEDASINAQLQGLIKALKSLQVTRGIESLDYDDLCIHTDIEMPIGYKPLKFDMFDGKGDPHTHLKAYCDKLVDEMVEDFMTHFRFNTEITAERFSLANKQKKPSENFQEYARHWRTEAAGVQPPLDENELSKYFIRAQEGIYFDKMMSMMGQKFAELVKMGDFIEESVKSGKIQSMVALQAANRAIQSGAISGIKKKREIRLRTVGVLQPVEGKLPDPIPHNFDGNKRCGYHSRVQGHDTEDCYGLKNQIESLIRKGVMKCTITPSNVNNKPLPNHENREVNMVTLDDEYGVPDYPNIDEADAMTSSAQPIITVQLREPLTVQTYLPRIVVTTLIARKPESDTKVVPWDYQAGAKEVTIHGELNHPIHSVNLIPVTNELDGATFHTLEIMQVVRVNDEADPHDTKLSSATRMVALEMLKYGYQPKSGLAPKSNGIVEPIQLKHQRGTNGLRYEPTLGRVHHASSKAIFIPEQALIPDQADIDEIIEGIGDLFVAMARR
ncbi:hypothetical protein H5410_061577 [Solanum commersonii]|uniref:DUF7745 domain-containing protein n=1 Tax=Solanum commersonii TaxID=4109 RepID=A0A9J5W842_SOLCO|nr:hypothetical protein H5410_061577 [Solanum commersonii]